MNKLISAIKAAIVPALLFAIIAVLFQLCLYEVGIVGRNFLSIDMQIHFGSSAPTAANDVTNDCCNCGE